MVSFGKLAETLAPLSKGDEVLVTGSLHRTEYTKDGVKHRDVKVRARAIEFLRRKSAPADTEAAEGLEVGATSPITDPPEADLDEIFAAAETRALGAVADGSAVFLRARAPNSICRLASRARCRPPVRFA